MSSRHHEDFSSRVHGRGPSERNFGAVFCAFFLFLALGPLLRHRPMRPVWLGCGIAVLLITLLRPSLLGPANRVWTRIGILLGKVMNPIVTGLLFYLVFTPAAVVLRWMGKDLLELSRREDADSYWIRRSPATDATEMINQF